MRHSPGNSKIRLDNRFSIVHLTDQETNMKNIVTPISIIILISVIPGSRSGE